MTEAYQYSYRLNKEGIALAKSRANAVTHNSMEAVSIHVIFLIFESVESKIPIAVQPLINRFTKKA